MRGHCTCKAPKSFPDRYNASGELLETCLGIAAAYKVLHLLPFGGGTTTLELAGKFKTGRVSNLNVVPFGIPSCTINSMKTTPNLFLSQYKDI